MIKTLIAYGKIVISLIKTFPLKSKYKKLIKQKKFTEADDFIASETKKWANKILDITGTSVTVKGLENIPEDESCVFISNHQGNLDVVSMLASFPRPVGFISKKELKKVPILSNWMNVLNCIFLDRTSPKQSFLAIQEGIEKVKNGHSMLIFPEGTRSRGQPVKEFKKGSFKLAFQAECPIVPVSADGSYHVIEETGKLQKGTNITLTIHRSIPTKNLTREQKLELIDNVRQTIINAIPPEHLITDNCAK
jgi:1-acyl-sn-glycerol-3-phosphate acyltransferase